MLPVLAGLASTFISKAADIIREKVEDKDKANELIAELQQRLILSEDKALEEQAKIILAEAQGSWLQRNWRPILMLTVVAIVANNYLLFPYLSLFTSKAVMLELPEKLWNLMLVGVGGYIAGRSGEKIASILKRGTA